MIRQGLVVASLLVMVFAGWSVSGHGRLGSQESCQQENDRWVAAALTRMQSIKPGMTRGDLLKVFRTEGGFSTGLHRTYVSRDCSYFKVDVHFHAVGRSERDEDGSVTLVEDDRDSIATISGPYLQFAITD